MKKLSAGILSGVIVGFSVSANAGLLVDPIGKSVEGSMQVGVSYSEVTTTYKSDGYSETSDIKRNGVTIYGARVLNDKMDAYAGFTYNMTTKFDDPGSPDGESGFEFGGGIRGELLDLDKIKLVGYAQLEYVSEKLISGVSEEYKDNLSLSGIEFIGGVLGVFSINDGLFVYGGLELAPFGTIKFKSEDRYGGNEAADMERDSILGIRLGTRYTMANDVFVRGEFAAVGESSFTIGAGVNF